MAFRAHLHGIGVDLQINPMQPGPTIQTFKPGPARVAHQGGRGIVNDHSVHRASDLEIAFLRVVTIRKVRQIAMQLHGRVGKASGQQAVTHPISGFFVDQQGQIPHDGGKLSPMEMTVKRDQARFSTAMLLPLSVQPEIHIGVSQLQDIGMKLKAQILVTTRIGRERHLIEIERFCQMVGRVDREPLGPHGHADRVVCRRHVDRPQAPNCRPRARNIQLR